MKTKNETKTNRRNFKHGDAGTRFYQIWNNMINRCNNANNSNYGYYGGRGIKVIKRWEDYLNFKADMYERYQEMAKLHGESEVTIDRINNNGNYEPSNTRWATKSEQSLNKRRRKDNTSGYTGVSLDRTDKRWRATIAIDGKQKNIGSYADIDKAVRVRRAYEAYYYNTIQINGDVVELQRLTKGRKV